ncbi:MAG: hypothetical protein KGZ96_01985 [Clostridia bacterium]|jgi:6-phosphofructokinase 1|nr:hypothetical protein [Clostridia bacterium]
MPEIVFDQDKFIDDVNRVYNRLGYVYIVASEGLVGKDGNYLAAEKTKDSFGHAKLGNGLANTLKEIITNKLKVKVRCNILGTSQRSAMHYASRTDANEAYITGTEAVTLAVGGVSGVMVTINPR